MAATNPTVKSCPTTSTTGYRFEPTGTYRPFDMEMPCPPMTMGYPVDMTGYYPTKTYSSIFNKPSMMMTPTEAAFAARVPSTIMTPTPVTYPLPPVYERPIENWNLPAWNPASFNNWMMPTVSHRMPYELTMPMTPYWPINNTMMAPRSVFEPTLVERRPDLLSCTPFERILYRFLNAVDNMWSVLPRGTEWLAGINSRPTTEIEYYCLTNPIRICDREGNRELCLCFDMRGYKPEEINVTLNKTERCILVEACHEIKEGKEHHVLRKYSRRFVFPESLAKIDLAKCDIRSCFSPEGFLVIECTLPRMTTEEMAKIPQVERFFTSPLMRDTVCPSVLNTPINTKPVNVKMC